MTPGEAGGVRVLCDVRHRRLFTRRCPKGTMTLQRAVLCRDCGHSWWTVMFDSELKLRAILDGQRQLSLPGVVAEAMLVKL